MARKLPNLGNNLRGEDRCTRLISGGPCLRSGHFHIIWEGNASSVACVDCGHFAMANRIYIQAHIMVKECVDSHALWYRDEWPLNEEPFRGTCRIPVTPTDLATGRVLFDY